jgi:hypothetical protein
MLKQKRAQGKPKTNSMKGIKKAMNERNLNECQWKDRKQWSLGVVQRRKFFETDIYIYIYIYIYIIRVLHLYKVCLGVGKIKFNFESLSFSFKF